MDAKEILIKYICHVAVAEGVGFATDTNLSPAAGDMKFTDDEERFLEEEIFPIVKAWWAE